MDPLSVIAGSNRIRVLNASNTGYLQLSGPGVVRIGGDQGLLAAQDTAPFLLAPGDRAELELPEGAIDLVTASWSLAGPSALGEPVRVSSATVTGAAALPWPFAATSPTPDPGHTDVRYVFTGDVHTGQWLINGEQFPDITIETVALGSEAVLEVRNLSPTEHPFHLHGQTFEVLSVDGVPPAVAAFEDTVNVGIRQTVRLLVAADNPGDWMAHCHILPHAHDGMMTVLRVE